MNSLTQHASFELAPGSALQLDGARGARIRIAQGQVWLTESGQLDDNVLSHGDEYTARSTGAVVVEALTVARIQIERDARVMATVEQIARGLWSTLTLWARARIAHMQLG